MLSVSQLLAFARRAVCKTLIKRNQTPVNEILVPRA